MAEIDDLRRRLAAAEKVCYLFGITGVRHETQRERATLQAWMDWHERYDAEPVPDEEIDRLAQRRREIREATLRRIDERDLLRGDRDG